MARVLEPEASGPASQALRQWSGFQRARRWLWVLLVVLVAAGALLHDSLAHFFWMRLLWLLAIAVALGRPLNYLLGFRCPRCAEIYLATGRLRDFLSVHRVLWATRCGSCALRAGQPARR